MYAHLPAAIFVAGDSPVLEAAKNELIRGVGGMLGKTLHVEQLASYMLKATRLGGHFVLLVAAPGGRGVLYGVFALLRHIALGHAIEIWTHVLQSGKTVIQHIYDSHYEGAARGKRSPSGGRS